MLIETEALLESGRPKATLPQFPAMLHRADDEH